MGVHNNIMLYNIIMSIRNLFFPNTYDVYFDDLKTNDINSTNGTITSLNSTNGTIGSFSSTSGTITSLNSTNGTIGSFSSTSGTIGSFSSTTGNIGTVNAGRLNITTTKWEDLQLIGSLRVGGTAPAFGNYDGTGVYMYEFSSSAINELHSNTQIPHACSGLMIPHVHWITSTNGVGSTKWNIKIIIWKGMNSTYATALDETITSPAPAVEKQTVIANFSQIDVSNIGGVDYRPSGIMAIRIRRLGNDGGDDYAGTSWLGGFDIHYSVGQFGGSISTYP